MRNSGRGLRVQDRQGERRCGVRHCQPPHLADAN
jgi:hypothetical protein